MSESAILILWKIVEWAILFGLGLLFRKRVGRFIIKTKKWLLNDVVATRIVSIRTYTPEDTPVEIADFNMGIYEEIRAIIPNPRFHDIFEDGMRIAIPTFGTLKLSLSKISEEENMEHLEETVERIKVTLQPESPVRLGVREVHLLNDYSQTAEILFNATARLIATRNKIRQDYTILEFPRFGRFVEEKTFEIDDKNLGARVHATPNKLTIVVSPTSQIAKATSKYLLV